ncbi:MAG: ribosomal L7Ae/L30e/S12e/Gadd45 family protein [Clostridia bacterium]|nr:ribosomal L7Ae/L30e/S12e/Gadd45 family protein [Clostridia bacterium]
MQDKILRLLGLARRAGELTYGQTAVITEIKKGHTKLLLFAKDFNSKTKQAILNNCQNIKSLTLPYSMEEFGFAIGAKPTGVLSVNNENFRKGILEVNSFEEKENI